jgi:hypothetical protein
VTARYRFIFYCLLGALFLMLDAFYNGYPIVYSDTSTYLASGFHLETPVDRPITYGLFIRITSINGISLWLTIFCQSLILSYLLFLFMEQFVGEKFTIKYGLLLILLISLFTGSSWTSSQLMADIFTPIAALSLALILFGNLKKSTQISLIALYVISICMHIGHVLFFGILLITVLGLKKWFFEKDYLPDLYKKLSILFVLTLASILTMGSAISKSKDVFMMGAMVEQGITKQYLDEYCGTKQYKICQYKDSLPKTFNAFVWDTNSVFYKTGGWAAENRKEYNDIIMSTFKKPKYIFLHIAASLKATLTQLASFAIADGNGIFLNGTELYARITKFVGRETKIYSESRQNRGEFLFVSIPNKLYNSIVFISALLLLLLLVFYSNRLNKNFKRVAFFTLIAIVINAWDSGTFSCVADRFGCKMMWLLPLLAIIALVNVTQGNNQLKQE